MSEQDETSDDDTVPNQEDKVKAVPVPADEPATKAKIAPANDSATEAKPAPAEDPAAKAKSSVSKGSLLVLALIVGSLSWYFMADRFTPYTSQARVEGYVIGVAPKVAGVVTEIWVKNNQEVAKDQPLFQIDPAQYQIALDKTESDLQTARRQVDAGSASVETARANLLAAKANEQKANKDYTRQKRLREQDPGTISLRRLEVSRATLEQARAGVTAAESEIRRAIEQKGGDNDETNAILQTAKVAVEKAELDLLDTTVKASSSGVITDLRADVGQYAGTGSPVLTLISIHDVWINAEFTENNLGHMKVGSRVEILFDVLPGRIFEGQVRSIGIGVSATQPPPPGSLPTIQNNRDWLRQAQRFPVIIEFNVSQDEILRGQLRIGGLASVIAYPEESGLLNTLGKYYIRMNSYLSYAF
jgi:multidrug resistance efflux pump